MKVVVLEFPTRSLLGILDDAGAQTIADLFGLGSEPDTNPEPDEEIPSLVRLEWPARVEIMQWQQQEEARLAGQPAQMQLVSRPFAVMVGVSRLTVDAGHALAAEVFDVTEAHVAQIGDNGVTPAKAAWSSDEPLVAIYLQALDTVVARGFKRGTGRQRVRAESK